MDGYVERAFPSNSAEGSLGCGSNTKAHSVDPVLACLFYFTEYTDMRAPDP